MISEAVLWFFGTLFALLVGTEVVKRWREGAIHGLEKRLGKRGIWILVVLVALATGATRLTVSALDKQVAAKEAASRPTYIGSLEPASDPTPDVHAPPGAVLLLLGNNLTVWTKRATQHVLRCGTKEFIRLGLKDDRATVSAVIVDSSGDRRVLVVDNEFQTSEKGTFIPKKPDPSTYVVREDNIEGTELLRLRYMNQRTIWLTGRFAVPSGGIVEIERDRVRLGPITYEPGSTLGNNEIDLELCGGG